MNRNIAIAMIILLLAGLLLPAANTQFVAQDCDVEPQSFEAGDAVPYELLADLEQTFTQNKGQIGTDDFDYYSAKSNIAFASGHVMLYMPGRAIQLTFVGANDVAPQGIDPADWRSNYFIGNDPDLWYTGITSYRQVVYPNLWDGIDLVYYLKEGQLKYDFVLQPDADHSLIRILAQGQDNLEIVDDDLKIAAGGESIIDSELSAFYADDIGQTIESCFVLNGDGTYGFELTGRDSSRSVIIDPLVYSTYLGGSGTEQGQAIAVDDDGCAYVTGVTDSLDFPSVPGSFQSTTESTGNVFVTKLSKGGSQIEYSTYIGGLAYDMGRAIAVDADGNAYVTGETFSTRFPTTPGTIGTSHHGVSDAFVFKLGPGGDALAYSTFVGGTHDEQGNDITVDDDGYVYLTGYTWSGDFPATGGAASEQNNGDADIFVMKLGLAGDLVLYSTYLGGSGSDIAYGMVLDDGGYPYIAGITKSTDYPNDWNITNATGDCAFVTKLNKTGNSIVNSVVFGGTGSDQAMDISLSQDGFIHVTGQTDSLDFLNNTGGQWIAPGGYTDCFAVKIKSDFQGFNYSVLMGGSGADAGQQIGVDAQGYAIISGTTTSGNMKLVGSGPSEYAGSSDIFLVRLGLEGKISHRTYLGGSGSETLGGMVLADGDCPFVTGVTDSGDYDITVNNSRAVLNGTQDSFISKLDMVVPVADVGPKQYVNESNWVYFDGTGTWDNNAIANYTWSFFDGIEDAVIYGPEPRYFFTVPGEYTVNLEVWDHAGNWDNDSVNITIKVYPIPIAEAGPDQNIDAFSDTRFNGTGSTDNIAVETYRWDFTDGINNVSLTGPEPAWNFEQPGTYQVNLTVMDEDFNKDQDIFNITVKDSIPPVSVLQPNVTINPGQSFRFDGTSATDNVGVANITWEIVQNGTNNYLLGAEPSFRFWEPGDHIVTQTVTDQAGNSVTNVMLVTVTGETDKANYAIWMAEIVLIVALLAIVLQVIQRLKKRPPKTPKPDDVESIAEQPEPSEENTEKEKLSLPDINLMHIIAIALAFAMVMPGLVMVQAQTVDPDARMVCATNYLVTTNPLTAEEESGRILDLIYEGATRQHPDTKELMPYIAVGAASNSASNSSISWQDCVVGDFGYCPSETWQDPNKPEIIIFYDFEGVYWHDGEQMNIRDIMFSFHVNAYSDIYHLGNPLKDKLGTYNSNYSWDSWLFIFKAWESQDGSRAALRFELQAPLYSIFEDFISKPLYPYHIWANRDAGQLVDDTLIWCDYGYNKTFDNSWKLRYAMNWENPQPVGSGPFMWAGSAENEANLKRWDRHFYKPGFKYYPYEEDIKTVPYLQEISFLNYSSESWAVRDLESGDVDYIAWGISPESATGLAGNLDYDLNILGTGYSAYLGFNMEKISFGYDYFATGGSNDMGRPLRKAIAHCLEVHTFGTMAGNGFVSNLEDLDPYDDWRNKTAPSYDFDPPEAINILDNAGYHIQDTELAPGPNNTWLNPDGSFIGSGPYGQIELICCDSDVNLMQFQIATEIAAQFNNVGLYTTLVPLEQEVLLNRVQKGDYDVFVMDMGLPAADSSIYTRRPENWYYSTSHSNVYYGQNYYNYRNASVDELIDQAMAQNDRATEMSLVKDIMAGIAYDVPYNVLYYYSKIEVYRTERFKGMFDDGSGSLLNIWSMTAVEKQDKKPMQAYFVQTPSAVVSNSTSQVKVKVTDRQGNAISNVRVVLSAAHGTLLAPTGYTDEYGYYTTGFEAPYVAETDEFGNGLPVLLEIVDLVHYRYRSGPGGTTTIQVYPMGTMFLSVRASVEQDVIYDTDSLGNPGFTYVNVLVTDQGNWPVENVNVKLNPLNGNLTILADTETTNSDGIISFTVQATDVDVANDIQVNITAELEGYNTGVQLVKITVLPYEGEVFTPTTNPGTSQSLPFAFIILAGAAAVTIFYVWRRRLS